MLNKEISRRSFLTVSAMTAATFALDWRKIPAYAAKMGPKGDYPTVVIGAGLGGLCCAAHLARQGIPVTVVEQHNIPGGYATSFDRAGGKFTFEVSLHGTSINNNAGARMLKNLGVLEKLQLGFVNVDLPRISALPAPSNVLTNDVAYFRLHGRNAKAWYNPPTGSHRYDYLYNEEELDEWTHRVEGVLDAANKVYIFTNNCHKGSSFVNGLRLRQQFEQSVRSEVDAEGTLFASPDPDERIRNLTNRIIAARAQA